MDQKFLKETSSELDSSQLEIEDENMDYVLSTTVSTASHAMKVLFSADVRSKIFNTRKNFFITFKINDKIDDSLNSTAFAFLTHTQASGIICFKSLSSEINLSKIFWKQSGPSEFFILELSNELLVEFVQIFLEIQLKSGFNGILRNSSYKTNIAINQIGDNNGRNLLIYAVIQNAPEIVKMLLNFDIDLEYKDNDSLSAIDHAWEAYLVDMEMSQNNEILLILLNANSALPSGFNFETAPIKVQNFIEQCEMLHKLVVLDDLEHMKELVEESLTHLTFIYDRKNESLMSRAQKLRKFQIITYLESRNKCCGNHECNTILYKKDLISHSETMDNISIIHVLMSMTYIAGNDRYAHSRWQHIKEAYEHMYKNPMCSKILKLVAQHKSLRIFFDFIHETTYYLNPISSNSCGADLYRIGTIYIGAKFLLKEERKLEIFGILAHKFSHLAIQMTFFNNFNPYPCGESIEKEMFEVVYGKTKNQRNFNTIVKNVFESYDENSQHSELIVTVPQMMVTVQNVERLEKIIKEYSELYKYYIELVEPELVRAELLYRRLSDDENVIELEKLSKPAKSKLLHSEIVKFCGKQSSLFEIVGEDEEILKEFTSNQIRSALNYKTSFMEIGSSCANNDSSQIIIGRKFENISFNLPKIYDLIEIIFEIEKTKCMILCDNSKSGKTSTFCELAGKLQGHYTDHWISCISPKKFSKFLNKCAFMKTDSFDEGYVIKILLQFLNSKSKIEEMIFKKLYEKGKVILLLNGFDKICQDNKQFLIKLLKNIRSTTQNQIWISTLPKYGLQLGRSLNSALYKFSKLTWNNYDTYLQDKLKKLGIDDDAVRQKTLNKIENFVDKMKIADSISLVTSITEYHVIEKFCIDVGNCYEIYKHFWEVKCKENCLELRESEKLLEVHQVLALEHVFKGDHGSIVQDLPIMKSNREEDKFLLIQKYSKYGFVAIDMYSQLAFIHETFADYFVAEYILGYVFNDKNEHLDCGEMEIFFQFLSIVGSGLHNRENVQKFISNYIKKARNINRIFREYLIKNFYKLHQKVMDSTDFAEKLEIMKFWSMLLINDVELSRSLWGFDFYHKMMKNFGDLKSTYEDTLNEICNNYVKTLIDSTEPSSSSTYYKLMSE